MKKLILVAAMALVSVNLFAQFYVGGALSVASQSNTDRVANTNGSQFAFTLAPNAGFKLNDDMCVGGRLRLSVGSQTAGGVVTPSPVTFGIQPYFRYSFLYFGDFAIAGEASTSIAFTNQTTTQTNPGAADTITKTDMTTFSVGVTPVLLYQLNKHITLEANLNILTLGFISTTNKQTVQNGAGIQTTRDTTNSNFITAATTNDVFGNSFADGNGNTAYGFIQIGFTYAF